MGLRCSLLGHVYEDNEVEQEREERGEEVVVTIREYRTCTRCGTRTLVTENKEVRAATPPAGTPASRPIEGDGTTAPGESGDGTAPVAASGTGVSGTTADGPADSPSPEEEDAVILDDDSADAVDQSDQADAADEPAERARGEWPETDRPEDASEEPTPWPEREESATAESPSDEPSPWPDVDADDEGFEAGAPDEATPHDDVSVSAATVDDLDADSGFTSVGDGSVPETISMEGTELTCPECGYVDPAGSGSLRRGDICPECHSGYLAAGPERNR